MQNSELKTPLIEKQMQWFLNRNNAVIQTITPLKEATDTAAILQNPNFVRWFGNSKVVDNDGLPLVVYHGTARSFEEFGSWGSSTFHASSYLGGWFCDDIAVSSKFMDDRIGYKINANLVPVYLNISNPYLFEVDNTEIESAQQVENVLGRIENLIQEHMLNRRNPNQDDENYIYLQELLDTYLKLCPLDDDAKDLTYLNQVDLYEALNDSVYLFIDKHNQARRALNQLENNDPWQNMYRQMRPYIGTNSHTIADGVAEFKQMLEQQGYDGIILYGTSTDSPYYNGKSNQFVIFDPKQAKSIFNNGAFNPNTAKISERLN